MFRKFAIALAIVLLVTTVSKTLASPTGATMPPGTGTIMNCYFVVHQGWVVEEGCNGIPFSELMDYWDTCAFGSGYNFVGEWYYPSGIQTPWEGRATYIGVCYGEHKDTSVAIELPTPPELPPACLSLGDGQRLSTRGSEQFCERSGDWISLVDKKPANDPANLAYSDRIFDLFGNKMPNSHDVPVS